MSVYVFLSVDARHVSDDEQFLNHLFPEVDTCVDNHNLAGVADPPSASTASAYTTNTYPAILGFSSSSSSSASAWSAQESDCFSVEETNIAAMRKIDFWLRPLLDSASASASGSGSTSASASSQPYPHTGHGHGHGHARTHAHEMYTSPFQFPHQERQKALLLRCVYTLVCVRVCMYGCVCVCVCRWCWVFCFLISVGF